MEKWIGIPELKFQRSPYTPPQRLMGGGPGGPGGPEGMGGPGGPEGMGGPGGPGGEPGGMPGFGEMPVSAAAVTVKNGRLSGESKLDLLTAGEVTDQKASGLVFSADDGSLGGVLATGAGTDFLLENAKIHISGNGFGLGGAISGASVEDHASLTLRNVDIVADGKLRSATSCGSESVLKVYDSTLVSHGAPWDEREKQVSWEAGPGMDKPMVFLEIEGNTRAHCTVMNSETYFYNSTIVADAWAALSTDAAGSRVYLEANDCHVFTTRYGYGTYADTNCHCVLNGCDMTTADMAAIIAGESDVVLNDTYAKCGSYIALIHCVGGSDTEVSGLTIRGGKYVTQKCAVIVKSENADILIDGADITSYEGVLIRTRENDDPGATKIENPPVYGIHAVLRNLDTENGIAHGDAGRRMSVKLEHTKLRGAITGAPYVSLDADSFWYAPADSEIVLMGEAGAGQIDAPAGVTVRVKGAAAGQFALPSGGTLIMTAAE